MPDSGIGVVVLVNGVAAPYAVDQMANYIYDRLGSGKAADTDARYQTVFKKLVRLKTKYAHYFAKQAGIRRTRQKETLPHPLKAYTGTYENPALGTMTWTLRNGRLEASIGEAQSDAGIYSAKENQFRVELTGSGEIITFQFLGNDDRAASFKYNGYVFKRAEPNKS